MDDRIREAFDAIEAPERLKRSTKAALRKKTFDYGRNVYRLRQRRRRLAASLLTLTLVFSGLGVWFWPSSAIGVEINPSMELKVNAFDRVICLEGKNDDGREVARTLKLAGMEYGEAMQRLLLSRELKPYLDRSSNITITVTDGSNAHGEEMLSRVLCRAYNIAEEENILYCQVDWETVKAAREAGLCIPRYLAWQNLKKNDPTITVEQVRQIPREKIRVLAQTVIIENPCHE